MVFLENPKKHNTVLKTEQTVDIHPSQKKESDSRLPDLR